MFSGFRKECEKICGANAKYLEMPKNEIADLALPCFHLAKASGKNPIEIARSLEREYKKKKRVLIGEIKALGPYVNFYINQEKFTKQIVEEMNAGLNYKKTGKKVMVEYSGPNSNKPLHIGHLRNDTIGMAASNLLEFIGHSVIRANIVNDRGVHICKSMYTYKKWGKGEQPKKKGDHFVGDYYVMFEQKAKGNEKIKEEAQEMLKKWEAGDKETRQLWLKMRKWTLDGFHETYDKFGSRFDVWFFESDFYNKAKPLIEEGMRTGIFIENEKGDIVALLEAHGLPNKVLLRGDGTSVYITNDLALTKHKIEKYKLSKCIWVVASEQKLNFEQLFKIFELLGYSWHKDCHHLSYGLVNLPSGRMKSREGTVVDADDLIEEMSQMAKKEIELRDTTLSKKELEKRSTAIALSAIKYFMIKTDPQKDIMFNPEEAISLEGDTGPYLQYTYARAKSILSKSGKKPLAGPLSSKEIEITKMISKFDEIIDSSAEQLKPNHLANYLHELAARFNTYYHENKIIGSKNEQQLLAFVSAVSYVLKTGLELLGIEVLEKM
ncbi:MAG: arginine--tRNA ligase [Candidatus Aenigmarchaeota archaeon]|nr:arginine--tRNA ligase [Candidatus Aenigmarchaeota archaeon]